jgi:hypothetical protein
VDGLAAALSPPLDAFAFTWDHQLPLELRLGVTSIDTTQLVEVQVDDVLLVQDP